MEQFILVCLVGAMFYNIFSRLGDISDRLSDLEDRTSEYDYDEEE